MRFSSSPCLRDELWAVVSDCVSGEIAIIIRSCIELGKQRQLDLGVLLPGSTSRAFEPRPPSTTALTASLPYNLSFHRIQAAVSTSVKPAALSGRGHQSWSWFVAPPAWWPNLARLTNDWSRVKGPSLSWLRLEGVLAPTQRWPSIAQQYQANSVSESIVWLARQTAQQFHQIPPQKKICSASQSRPFERCTSRSLYGEHSIDVSICRSCNSLCAERNSSSAFPSWACRPG